MREHSRLSSRCPQQPACVLILDAESGSAGAINNAYAAVHTKLGSKDVSTSTGSGKLTSLVDPGGLGDQKTAARIGETSGSWRNCAAGLVMGVPDSVCCRLAGFDIQLSANPCFSSNEFFVCQ
ncbi:MAG: hypothetical protein OXC81_04065 [Betaproteobacteria bacterium]|nr:hypothetical protein [Betaproteobacteria bacterium]